MDGVAQIIGLNRNKDLTIESPRQDLNITCFFYEEYVKISYHASSLKQLKSNGLIIDS